MDKMVIGLNGFKAPKILADKMYSSPPELAMQLPLLKDCNYLFFDFNKSFLDGKFYVALNFYEYGLKKRILIANITELQSCDNFITSYHYRSEAPHLDRWVRRCFVINGKENSPEIIKRRLTSALLHADDLLAYYEGEQIASNLRKEHLSQEDYQVMKAYGVIL